MSQLRNEKTDDLVSRAVAATRQLPLPDGPTAAISSQTLAAVHQAARQPRTTFLQRAYQMPWTSKTIALLATAASLAAVYAGLSIFAGRALAFADVVAVLNKVHTATWKTTTEVKGPDNKTTKMTGVGMFLAPSHERTEISAEGAKSIQIIDGQKDKIVTLAPASQMAIIFELKNLPPKMNSPFGRTFQGLRGLVAMAQDDTSAKVQRLGAETIDGRRAEGFRIEMGAVEVKIWADPQTLLPVRVEETSTTGTEVHIVMTDFQIDVDLDESLFSLDVPSGYTVQQPAVQIDVSKRPISYLAETLKLVAEMNNGVFPPTLRGEEGIEGIVQRSAKASPEKYAKEPREELLKRVSDLGMKLGGTFGFLYSLSTDNDWHYAGNGVKLNTSDRPIFWYRRNKTSTTYEVLYADLSVKEVPADEVPKVPSSDEVPKP